MSHITLDNGHKAWAFSSSQYVQEAVKNVERHLKTNGDRLSTRANSPFSLNYRPEVDLSDPLDSHNVAYFQSLIGVLRWIVELGRADIACEVSMLSSYMALPREGHLSQLFHIFAYLQKNHNAEMVFGPTYPDINMDDFLRQTWSASEFSTVKKDKAPTNAPQPRGLGFVMTAYVDADHASDCRTRRSRTGFAVFLNKAPIFWMSKRQNSVETSSFGSEFVAMRHCTEYLRSLRYKLRMMGIPCEDPSLIFGDNKSVLVNASIPDSVLKKKHHSVAYHFVREGVAKDEWRMTYINTCDNLADMFTKPLPSGEKRVRFTRMILHHLFSTREPVTSK